VPQYDAALGGLLISRTQINPRATIFAIVSRVVALIRGVHQVDERSTTVIVRRPALAISADV
jgi:hypothetical protein